MASKNKNNLKKPQRSSKPHDKTPHQEEAQAPAEPTNRRTGIPVVGLGASAGGLQALETFFAAMPPETGMAFVVVTHLHPEHESHLAELLQKHTSMPAVQVNSQVKVEPNHVYVIPPNHSIVMTDSHLDIAEFKEPRGHRTPIDHFFRSMASDQRDSIAVILSGGGTDGAVGIKDIKELGGLLMVQHPEDAEYDSMPRAAIATGLADVVLPAAKLAAKLVDYIERKPQLPNDGKLSEQELETIQRILGQVQARTGHDFGQYKRSTILRRIERRMQLNGFETLEAYLAYLRPNANEARAMFNDILIGVTNFFRDHDSWKALETKVIPALFKNRDEKEMLRVWSIGCATGEEAYSLAMLLLEGADQQDRRPHIQIFASDLDERSIGQAREALYPTAIEADVSPERLERFFIREGEYYRVKREVRDIVLFANHNILRDPPFSRQDLITCRNVLIYLQREVQDKVFEIFHYALKTSSYLFLGSSESADQLPELFAVVDKAHRIYQARPWPGAQPHVPSIPLMLRGRPRGAEPYSPPRPHLARYIDESLLMEDGHQKALESYGPPSILINEHYTILHVSETAGRYLFQPKGAITGDLLKLMRPELQLELRTTLFRALEKNQSTLSRPTSVQFNGHARRVIVAIRPHPETLGPEKSSERRALVLFLEDELNEPEVAAAENKSHEQIEQDKLVAQLEAEVQRLREQLQVTIEEYDSSTEEAKATNEELQSINEEYRSATEELETSKEELQSVNEELQTVNSEMKSKLDELSRAHGDLENLMGASEIATLFLDRDLRIERFTTGIKELFNIMDGDRGRPIHHLTHKLAYAQIPEDAEQVLRRLIPLEREVFSENHGWFMVRFQPFRTIDDHIVGVVISFIDITDRKEAEKQLISLNETLEERVRERTRELAETSANLRQARDLFYTLFHANPLPTAITRLEDAFFLDVNEAYLDYFGLTRQQVLHHYADELNLPIDPLIRPKLIDQLQKEGSIRDLDLRIVHPSGETRILLFSLQLLKTDGTDSIIQAFIDITDRVQAEQQIRLLATELTEAEQQERRRISQVLHDDLQQRIFAVKMQVIMLRDTYQKGNLEAAQTDFNQLNEWLEEAISITRNLSIDFSPAILQGEGLTDALAWLAAQMQEQYGLEVHISSNGVNTNFDDTLRVLLFQAAREALFNIVKHAETLEAFIELEKVDEHIRIVILDHGAGFAMDELATGPHRMSGLFNVQQRLNLLGCHLQIQSQPNQGTQVTIDILPK